MKQETDLARGKPRPSGLGGFTTPDDALQRCLHQALEDPAEEVRAAALLRLVPLLDETQLVSHCRSLFSGGASVQKAVISVLHDAGLLWEQGWCLSQALVSPEPTIRVLCARLLSQEVPGCDKDALEALQADPDHRVREAALDVARATVLLEDPTQEASWRVLARAARLCKRSLYMIAPPDDALPRRAPRQRVDASWASLFPWQGHPKTRTLGKTGLRVAPLGISGHYGLDEAGFAQAHEAGINLHFWEPNYSTQTRFVQGLAPATRDSLVLTCGSFEVEPRALKRDLERALRSLKRERIDIFLLFWVRSWARLAEDALAMLQEAQQAGKIHTYGISTHQRSLARRAIEEGFSLVMVRHNAAHRGAEEEVFPHARQHNTGLLTFNNLIYGRMLKAPYPGQLTPPSAAECYQYSLGQPGVHASFCAPKNHAELTHNLQALTQPALPQPRHEALHHFGNTIYRENHVFMRCIRSR